MAKVTASAHGVPATVPVVIAGGGPVGLAAAIELGRRGVECLVVEPRPVVSHARPRCKTINVRTMEHLRRWGLVDRLRRRAPLPVTWSSDIVFCTSLAGYELSRFTGVLGLRREGDRFPEPGQQAPQYVLEELLREVVDDLHPCSLITGARVTGLDQDADSVRVTIAREDGAPDAVTAQYVLGCDGPRSSVRDAIGSAYVGAHALRPNFGMVFDAPHLRGLVRHGPAVQYWIVNRTAPALMGPLDLDGRWWLIAFDVDRETGERRARAIIDEVIGTPAEARIVSTDPWVARMQLVDRARVGRVFLAGDAAHLNPPFGGHGLNTGIGDAIDVAWKLAAVLDGWGGPRLLDSYEAERRPIQSAVIAAAEANMRVGAPELLIDGIDADGRSGDAARRRAHDEIQRAKGAEFHALDLVLDLAYDDSPVNAGACVESRDALRARVGGRLPHFWLGPDRSVYDELRSGLALLAAHDVPAAAIEPVTAAARRRRVPLEPVRLPRHRLVPKLGAQLAIVRPDHHLAWIGDELPDDPVALVDRVRGAAP